MENAMQIFKNDEFGQVRIVEINNEPYFVGKDVVDILGYQNGSRDINAHVDEEDRLKYQISTAGQLREQTIINESGLYALILSSKLPTAKKFKHWVTHEVLPSIRKTGSYGIPQTYAEALQLAADQALMIEQQKAQLTAAKPKVQFYDQVRESEHTLSMNDAAKLLGIKGLGRNKLFEQLRSRGVLDDTNVPYQRFLNSGHFEVIEKPYDYNGMVGITKVTRVTQKGLQWISKEFSKVNP